MRVESQGFVDKKGGRTLYGRSRAYLRVKGRDYSLHRRGYNVVVINRRTGKDDIMISIYILLSILIDIHIDIYFNGEERCKGVNCHRRTQLKQ